MFEGYLCFCTRCVSSMLRAAQEEGLTSHKAVLKYVGERFRIKAELPAWTSDDDVTRHLLMYVAQLKKPFIDE